MPFHGRGSTWPRSGDDYGLCPHANRRAKNPSHLSQSLVFCAATTLGKFTDVGRCFAMQSPRGEKQNSELNRKPVQ